jgi:hypothetical protein
MYTGYITNQNNAELASDYEAAILVWYKRLKSMYLPQRGFCLYPPEEGGARTPDTYCAPLGVKHLLNLPTAAKSGLKSSALREMLDDIHTMVNDAAAAYKIENPPRQVNDCHDAYQVLISAETSTEQKARAAAFVRSRLVTRDGQTFVEIASNQPSYRLWGMAVSAREETAYAAASLLATRDTADLPPAIAATNYLTSQLNEEGRLYSTVDTAACLALMIELRNAGIVASEDAGRVVINDQEMTLQDALKYDGKVQSMRCLSGVVAAQATTETIEDWSAFKSQLPVEVRLERKGQAQQRFKVGDELDLVVRVQRYEPGLIVHVCLPDALARIVGGGQVKRFSLDFCEKNELRVPLAAVGATVLPGERSSRNPLLRWLGLAPSSDTHAQHWAIIVRNMFKEEQVGNPGLLQVVVDSSDR